VRLAEEARLKAEQAAREASERAEAEKRAAEAERKAQEAAQKMLDQQRPPPVQPGAGGNTTPPQGSGAINKQSVDEFLKTLEPQTP
jgi:hypothetical protein